MFKRFYISFLIFTFQFSVAFSQSNANWWVSNGVISFQDYNDVSWKSLNIFNPQFKSNLSFYNGEFLVSFDRSLHTLDSHWMTNPTDIIPEPNSSQPLLFHKNTNRIGQFYYHQSRRNDENPRFPSGVYYNEFNTQFSDTDSNFDFLDSSVLIFDKRTVHYHVVRYDTNQYYIFISDDDTVHAVLLKNSVPTYLDFYVPKKDELFPPFPFTPIDTSCTFRISSNLGLENIVITKRIGLRVELRIANYSINEGAYSEDSYEVLTFNPTLGKFQKKQESRLLSNHFVNHFVENSATSYQINSICLSENDSFMYLPRYFRKYLHQGRELEFLEQNWFVDKIPLFQPPLPQIKKQQIFETRNRHSVGLGLTETPSGTLAMHYNPIDNSPGYSILEYKDVNIPISNNIPSVTPLIPNLPANTEIRVNHNRTLNHLIKDHIRLRYKVDFDCGATVKFENFSNPYRKFDTFTWWITNEEGTIDTIVTHEPELRYTKNGSYFYKVYGRSNQGYGYGEMWYDSIKINIPPKPIARFRALDTVVCAYQPVGFHNTSSASSVHPTKEQKWVYTFGDGSTRTLTEWKDSVQHTYNQPGVYTVSLFYSNGYCDSTLVLNQHVRVVDAPEPGFVIAEMQGCAPFDIHITDTITVNTVKKEYSFDNGLTWKEVPVNQPDIDHSYTESGVYWVTQRLHGYTGCITQVDSIQVFVSKGFTASDTSHIFVATWQDVLPKQENWVSIQLNCMDETAHSYELKRNNQTMATFTECNGIGSFEDKEANANPNLRYRIVAADSCGRSTQVGSIGQPIFLQGAIQGQNEWAIIEFGPYADIQHQSGEFAYDIQTFSEGNWKTIHQPNAAGLFEDKPLISNDVNALEKCYRIVGQNQAQISISNVLCLPYLPSVILPSAFSPNDDALNEIYRPLTLGIVSYQMEIYNRWGQLIYSGDESQIGWDGNNAPQGVYVVKIQGIDNQHYFHSYVGSVTLVR